MCGLAGIISLRATPDMLARQATSMADAIAHRGPDSSGVWASSTHPIALSHRRLSILDLSPLGGQPMISESGNDVIAFNGEIYNFSELRVELENHGMTFNGHSDTEVLLSAIETYGVDDTLAKIRGMFAIAHWDNNLGTLNLIRDPIGEKPLYYGIIENTFVFASELKAIYKIFPANTLTIDKQALNSYLRYGYISAPATIFKEISKLSPGTKATLEVRHTYQSGAELRQNIKISRYWSVAQSARNAKPYDEGATEKALSDADHLINQIIQEQAVADVPLGTFLSGGIDSSLVSGILQSQSATAIETFTIGFHEKTFNEAEFAKDIANHIGSNHNELYLSAKNALDVIPKLATIYDEPFADASQIPTFLVSKFAKSKLSVCLSGDGGDELFGGYNRYIQGEKFNNINNTIPSSVRTIAARGLKAIPAPAIDFVYDTCNKILARKGGANFGSKMQKAAAALNFESAEKLYQYLCSYSQNPSALLLERTSDDVLPSVIAFDTDFQKGCMAWDQQWYLPGDNLVKSDRASMANSLEMRTPLLDKALIEFSWRLPNSMKYRHGKSKWLLREVLYKYVPRAMIDRPKMGFSVPISYWIRNELKEWAESLLSPDFIKRQALFNHLEVSKLLDQHLYKNIDHGNRLWTLLMFQLWYIEHSLTTN